MAKIIKFFSRLNSQRAFILFSIALAAGACLIFANVWKPVGPAIPVFVYGAVLVAAQRIYLIQFDPHLKDSPYFLGFILTLFEIFDIVLKGFPQQTTDKLLFNEIGAGILTTAIGLLMRQLLLANDRSEETQDRIFRSLVDEIRRDVVDFHNTQKLFVKLLKEFAQTREQMFSDEEKVSAQYLNALKNAAQRIGEIPSDVEGAMNMLRESGGRIADAAISLDSDLTTTIANFRSNLEAIGESFTITRNRISDELDAFAQTINSANDRISSVSASAEKGSLVAEGAANRFGASVDGFTSKVNDAGVKLQRLSEDLSRIAADLNEIDQITDDLIRILRERIDMLAATAHRERSI
jgi:hypothetical protein